MKTQNHAEFISVFVGKREYHIKRVPSKPPVEAETLLASLRERLNLPDKLTGNQRAVIGVSLLCAGQNTQPVLNRIGFTKKDIKKYSELRYIQKDVEVVSLAKLADDVIN